MTLLTYHVCKDYTEAEARKRSLESNGYTKAIIRKTRERGKDFWLVMVNSATQYER